MKPAEAIGWTAVDSADRALAQQCACGDEAACRALVEQHQHMVLALAQQLLGNADEARDLTQEVFLRVFRTIARFRGTSSLRTWIYRIALNGARNRHRWWHRRQSWQVSLTGEDGALWDPPAPPQVGCPERLLERKELAHRLWWALARLPLDQRAAIILRELHGLRYTEIAFSMEVTVGAVKTRLARGRRALRKELGR